nr:hypothetical protein [Tanacetum cinerariifolium]
QANDARYWKIPACFDDDNDCNFAITPNEPIDSLGIGDEHLNTILVMKSDEFIKSSVENLIPILSEFEDSDSLMEEIDLSFTPDDPMPPGIEEDDDDSEKDILICEELLDNYSLSLPVPIPGLTITLVPNKEKSPNLLSHRGLEIFQPSAKCPMMIHGKNIPILDFPLFHFYPLDQFKYGGNWVKLSDLKQALRGRHPMLIPKDHFEIVTNSNDDISSSDDDSLHEEKIEYVEASPHNSELVSLEAVEIVIPEVEEIEDDNLREKFVEAAEIVIPEEEEIEDDNLREKLLNVHLLIANIEALKDNPTQSSEFLTKSPSTSLKSFLEVTNTFHNSLPEFENFYFDLEEISSGSTTTHSDISLSEYDSFIFDLTHEEFADELAHIISPPEYDCFYFCNLPDPGELMSVLNSGIRENISFTTCVNLPIEDDHSPLLAYVVWIFLAYLTIPGNSKTLAKGFYPSSLNFLSFNWES